jgi:IS4 transposase
MDKDTHLSSFSQWLNQINFKQLDETLGQTGGDKYVKKLTTKAYMALFLYAHLQKEDSLRSISDCVLSEDLQKATGLSSISAAQLSRKNNSVDLQLLMMIFLDLVAKIKGKRAPKTDERLKVVDSSTIPLNAQRYPWAHFRKTKADVKLHLRLVFMGKGQVFPEKAVLTSAQVNDRSQLDVLVDEKEAMYVFDRGYVDDQAFDRFSEEGMFFASRLKKNAVIHVLHNYKVPEKSPILSDQMILLGGVQNQTENAFRLIVATDDQGKNIRIITNRFDLSATEISDVYRHRWAIELFFKWLKQHVRIQTFYGQSETAVQNQILLALIHYCLFVLIQQKLETMNSVLQLTRWFKAVLWKSCEQWFRRIRFQMEKRKRVT